MAIAAAMRHGDRPGAELDKALSIIGDQTFGRGSWIRTNDLQYPKLPRYQAALYPDCPRETTSIHAKSAASKAGRPTGFTGR
jgi:hypothetical protein